MLFAAFAFLLVFPIITYAQQETEYAEGYVLIKVVTPFSNIEIVNGIVSTEQNWFDSIAQQYQVSELHPIFSAIQGDLTKYYMVVFDSSHSVENAVNSFQAESDIEIAEPDYLVEILGDPNDPFITFSGLIQRSRQILPGR